MKMLVSRGNFSAGISLYRGIRWRFTAAPWMVLFPGFALSLLVFGVNVFGGALQDVLDPRLRGR